MSPVPIPVSIMERIGPGRFLAYEGIFRKHTKAGHPAELK